MKYYIVSTSSALFAMALSGPVTDAFLTPARSLVYVYPNVQLQSSSTSWTVSATMRSARYSTSDSVNEESICPLLDPPVQPEATFEAAMGWFWGPQRDFEHVDVEGILDTVVGYTGSQNPSAHPNPTYQNIEDYAEAIRVTFDPSKISYKELLDMMFAFATPSDPCFAGTQYRSAIFYHTPVQKQLAEEAAKLRGRVGSWISIEPATDFYRAEEYHQNYIDKQTMSMFI